MPAVELAVEVVDPVTEVVVPAVEATVPKDRHVVPPLPTVAEIRAIATSLRPAPGLVDRPVVKEEEEEVGRVGQPTPANNK